jgi:hypothetical protein
MTQIHVDVFPTSTMDVGLKLVTVAHGESAGWVSLGTLTPNQWNSVNIPLSSFTMSAKTDIKQVGFVTTGSFGTFYMDNLYFFTGTSGISNVIEENGIKCFPGIAKNSLTVSADNEISEVSVLNLAGQNIKTYAVNSNSQTITLYDISSGQYFVRIKMANGQIGTKKFVKL